MNMYIYVYIYMYELQKNIKTHMCTASYINTYIYMSVYI